MGKRGIIRFMSDYVTVTIPGELAQRAKSLARARRQPVEDIIAEVLDEALPPAASSSALKAENDAAMAREMKAYEALHPTLKADYLGQYVAIREGRLIDHDADPAALYARIVAGYPEEFVWIAPVEEQPLTTLLVRSPRVVMQG